MSTAVLVTGGAGFIGSHTSKRLARAGYEPVVYDNLVNGNRWAVKWGPFVEGDLADPAILRRVLREYSIQAVIHFAAYAYVGESMRAAGKYFVNNVTNTLNLLEAMRETGVKNIVFSSSCATYGIPSRLPIQESEPQSPISPYGETKLMAEKALRWYVRRVEQYIQAHTDKPLRKHAASDVRDYLLQAGRSGGLQGWQFRQVVHALQLLFTGLVRADWS